VDNIWGHSSDLRVRPKREVCPLSLDRGEGPIVPRGGSPFKNKDRAEGPFGRL